MIGTIDRYFHVIPGGVGWTEQLARLLFVWVVCLAAQTVQREKGHFIVDIFVKMLGSKPRFLLVAFTDLLSLAFLGLIVKEAITYAVKMTASSAVSRGFLDIPVIVYPVPLIIGMVLMTCFYCVQWISSLRRGGSTE